MSPRAPSKARPLLRPPHPCVAGARELEALKTFIQETADEVLTETTE
jgi:hypothetical protein